MTFAWTRANTRAIALPIPELAPVTTQVRENGTGTATMIETV
jgi:hypothetical protein